MTNKSLLGSRVKLYIHLSKHNLEKKIPDSFKRGFHTAAVSIIKRKKSKELGNEEYFPQC